MIWDLSVYFYNKKWIYNKWLLSEFFLFPGCLLSLVCLNLLEPDRSLVLGVGPVCDCCWGFPLAGIKLLCKHMDITKSTSGDGPTDFP